MSKQDNCTGYRNSVLKEFLIGQDQSLNTLVRLSDGQGYADEMLSARAWRLRDKHPKLRLWIDRLFFWDKNHCEECYKIELERRQLPPEYRSVLEGQDD